MIAKTLPAINRRRTLAVLGGLGISALLPAETESESLTPQDTAACSIQTPQVTEGPYWVDEKLFRSDITTDPSTGVAHAGTPLALTVTVINSNGGACAPLVGAWVDIWHCDAKGIYSDESTYNPGGGTGNVNTTGQKFLRGYQITDANGQVKFTTIYPGWYAGRTIHIHARIRTWTTASYTTELAGFVTQFFFDDSVSNSVLQNSAYSRTTARDTTNNNDGIYNVANKTMMLLTLTQTASGYAGAITVDVNMLAPAVTATLPQITSAGVVNGASGAAGTTPGAWVSIYGSNLASVTYAAQASDLSGSYLPARLQGVSVQIDGQAAYIDYVSPTQVNVLAPADSKTGAVSISVTNSAGMSNSVTVTQSAVLPGLFASSGYLLAVRPTDGVIINGTGASVSGYTVAAAAKGGDALEIFATGLGPTVASTAPGLVFSGADQLANTATATIGGQNATVLWAGLVAAGLYQINLLVPSGLTAGNNAVLVSVAGVSSQTGVSLKIQ
jgi:uncharacterized protein (TIGR03437 family)